jgi:hypothetical protein
MPTMDAPTTDPSHTAIATPRKSTSREKNSFFVGGLFSMSTAPTAVTTGIEALNGEGRGGRQQEGRQEDYTLWPTRWFGGLGSCS